VGFIRLLSFIVLLTKGNPDENYEQCKRPKRICIANFQKETYDQCMFWCNNSVHCAIGARLSVALVDTSKKSRLIREGLREALNESWTHGGCKVSR
jgi:hypothetical protein